MPLSENQQVKEQIQIPVFLEIHKNTFLPNSANKCLALA